jgi:hypothetical protein
MEGGGEVTQKHKNTRSNLYATRSDFCRIYVEQMNSLYLLSPLLTADPQKAEQCFLAGLEDSARNNYVFKERAHSWARRSIIVHAIRLLCPRPGEETESNGARLLPLIGNVPPEGQAYPDFARIVALNSFERFVFIMSILEKYSAQECSLLLGCFRRFIINAQATAVRHLATVVIALGNTTRERLSLLCRGSQLDKLASPLGFPTQHTKPLKGSYPEPYKFLQTPHAA